MPNGEEQQKNPRGEFPIVPRHSHTGVDSPLVQFIDLDGVRNYRVSFATATISDGTALVRYFSTGLARFGDHILVAAPYALNGVVVTGYVNASGTSAVVVQNETGSTATLNIGTCIIKVLES